MAKPNRLSEISVECNEALTVLIPRTIEESGSVFDAARRLGVVPNTLTHWLKRNGLKVITRQVASVVPDAQSITRE